MSGIYHFGNIAKVIRTYRMRKIPDGARKPVSQSELSNMMGYKNGQFISNVERGLCSFPVKKLKVVCDLLDIPYAIMKEALMEDYSNDIDYQFRSIHGSENLSINSASTRVGEVFRTQ